MGGGIFFPPVTPLAGVLNWSQKLGQEHVEKFDSSNLGVLAPHCLSSPRECSVQISCRADQRKMGERLRKISEMLPV